MKKKILCIIKELNITTIDDINTVLKSSGCANKKIVKSNIRQLENDMSILKISSNENSLNLDGYIPGPNFESFDNVDIKKIVIEMELSKKDMNSINWEKISRRYLKKLVFDLEELKENILKRYKEPKKLEMDYFDISLRYHGLHGYFFDNHEAEFLLPANELLKECKSYLDNLEY